ncbi:MAG TPA: thioredoxin domain-containing protein [Thermoanaerobaculia bacterium]|nr:thioredoxin domain-containing protein [Thermoanaerobaculia bacterium]
MRTNQVSSLRGLMARSALVIALVMLAFTPSSAAEVFEFTVVGIDCEECSEPILETLRGIAGVEKAELDWQAGRAKVVLVDGFEKAKLKKAIDGIGFEAVFAGEQRPDLQPLPEEVRARLDIVAFTDGSRIDLRKILVPGKVTILDYYADWCSPCHLLDIRLQHLLDSNSGLAVRRIDVGTWDNDAARQATREFRLEALPYVRVYDVKGRFVGAVTGGSWEKIVKLVAKAESGN